MNDPKVLVREVSEGSFRVLRMGVNERNYVEYESWAVNAYLDEQGGLHFSREKEHPTILESQLFLTPLETLPTEAIQRIRERLGGLDQGPGRTPHLHAVRCLFGKAAPGRQHPLDLTYAVILEDAVAA